MSEFAPCIRSGFCCKQAPCGFGEPMSVVNNACRFLGGDEAGQHYCMKYEEIKDKVGSEISPAFGGGCGSAMNPIRIKLLNK